MAFNYAGNTAGARRTKWVGVALWTVQGLLAALFLFAGGAKLAMPLEEMVRQSGLPGPFLQFIAVCELLGAIGLILPGLFRIRTGLTPLAAAGLVIIMIGATVLSFAQGGFGAAAMPFVAGLLAAFTAYGRWRLAPQTSRGSNGPAAFQPAR